MAELLTRFCEDEAARSEDFLRECLTVTDGPYVGQAFIPMDWQEEFLRELFGRQRWSEERGEWVRLYQEAYLEVPRKNGKSQFMSALGLKVLFADDRGARIACVASDIDQANIIFEEAKKMVEASPELVAISKCHKRTIYNLKTGGTFTVRTSNSKGALGYGYTLVILDEALTQKDKTLINALTTGQGAVRQPLLLVITTAGDEGTPAWEWYEKGRAIEAGDIEPDPYFLYRRYGMVEGDDWTDEDVWRRCNPSIASGVLSIEYLRIKYRSALGSTVDQMAFRKFYLSNWNEGGESWMDMDSWDACGDAGLDEDAVRSAATAMCYLGLDLSQTTDTSSAARLYVTNAETEASLMEFSLFVDTYLPGDGIDARIRKENLPYGRWADAGRVKLTPGRTVDYAFIKGDVLEASAGSNLVEVGYDDHQANYLATQLEGEGLTCFSVKQGFWQSEAISALEKAVLDGRLRHDANPVMRFFVKSAVVAMGPTGRVKLRKDIKKLHIDGLSAAVNAMDRAIRTAEGEPEGSILDSPWAAFL